jgi:putative MATE family efflux protein
MNAKITTDFTEGNIRKQMMKFAVPLFFSNLLQAVYNMVDMIVIGQFVGKTGLSAVSIGGDVLNLLTFLAMGFSNAGQIIIAQHLGAGRQAKIGKIVANLFTFLIAGALIMSIVCFNMRNSILLWMNTPDEVWNYALDYVTTCILGLVFIYGYNVVSAVLRGMGDSRHPFMFIATAAIINLVLDLVFVINFHMAVFGVALATVIGQGISFIWGLAFLICKRREMGLSMSLNSFIPDRIILGMLMKLGFPMAIKSASVTFSKLFVDSWINSYGVVASSASGIESKMNVISNLFANAINMACSTMIGQNVGAEKYDRVPKIMKSAFAIVFTIALMLSFIVIFFPKMLFGIFTSDNEVINACMLMIPLIVLIFMGSAVRSPNNGLIDGSGNFKLNIVVALFDGIINRIGFGLLFGLAMGMGWIGFLYGDAVAGFTPLLIGSIYYFSGKWRTRKYIIK